MQWCLWEKQSRNQSAAYQEALATDLRLWFFGSKYEGRKEGMMNTIPRQSNASTTTHHAWWGIPNNSSSHTEINRKKKGTLSWVTSDANVTLHAYDLQRYNRRKLSCTMPNYRYWRWWTASHVHAVLQQNPLAPHSPIHTFHPKSKAHPFKNKGWLNSHPIIYIISI